MRTPPELKETVCGCQSSAIPLAISREMQPPILTPSSLFEEQSRMDALRLDVYNRILGTVHAKIKMTSRLPSSPQMTAFDVPEWQPGCPRFDVKDCILYIVWQLRHAGFRVLYISPNRLLISWKEQSIQYYQEDSPIRQAMLAASGPGTGSGSGSGSAGSGTHRDKDGKKKAAAYKPIAAEGVAGLLAGGAAKKAGPSTITFI